MLESFCLLTLWLISVSGWGFTFSVLFQKKFDLGVNGIIGIIGLGFLTFFINIFLPITSTVSIVIFIIGLLIFFIFYKPWEIELSDYDWITYGAIIVAVNALLPWSYPNSFVMSYELPLTNLIQKFALSYKAVNLFYGSSNFSIWYFLGAVFGVPFFPVHSKYVLNSTLIVFILISFFSFLRQSTKSVIAITVGILFIVFSNYFMSLGLVASNGVTSVFMIYLWFLLLRIVEGEKDLVNLSLFIALFTFMLQPLLFLMVLITVVVLSFSIIERKKFITSWINVIGLKTLFLIKAIFILWVIKLYYTGELTKIFHLGSINRVWLFSDRFIQILIGLMFIGLALIAISFYKKSSKKVHFPFWILLLSELIILSLAIMTAGINRSISREFFIVSSTIVGLGLLRLGWNGYLYKHVPVLILCIGGFFNFRTAIVTYPDNIWVTQWPYQANTCKIETRKNIKGLFVIMPKDGSCGNCEAPCTIIQPERIQKIGNRLFIKKRVGDPDIFFFNLSTFSLIIITLGLLGIIFLILTPLFFILIKEDYFVDYSKKEKPESSWLVIFRIPKNIVGVLLVVFGIILLFLPGQGLLTILIGFVLLDFPKKRELILKLVSKKAVFDSINWIRTKAHKPPIKI